jgi:DNA-binding CsgD family transcriptional regulator
MDVKYDTPTLLYASLMDETLKQLENEFHINFFHFARRIKDTPPFSISTNRTWHLKYKEEYEHNDTFMDAQKIKKYKNIYLWGSEGFKTKKEKMMHEERTKSFCIPPGISLINENENFTDSYSFSSSKIFQDRINIMLNQSNKLLEFGLNFSKKINPIISEHVAKNTLCVNNKLIKPIFPQKNIDKRDFHLSACSNISDQISSHTLFTQRQIECIYCTAQGLRSGQTGDILNISKRTVESILNSAMQKADCINRYQLIYQATKYGLIMEDMISPAIKLKIEFELNKKL